MQRTDENAVPIKFRSVTDAYAIAVDGAQHRNCKPINDIFEISKKEPSPIKIIKGEPTIRVKCMWGESNIDLRLILRGKYVILQKYTGQVVDVIGIENSENQ